MTWFITHKPAYDTDFVELPKSVQRQATQAHADLEQDPITPRGNTIKPLKGWENLWRYRLGDHRLIYSALPESQVVQLLAIGPRGDVYRRFSYDPEVEPDVELAFSAELAAGLQPAEQDLPEWMKHPEWFQAEKPQSAPLPRKLTPSRLNQWRIPEGYHDKLIRCQTEDNLAEADVPDWVLGRVMDALWPPEVQQLARQPDQLLVKPEDLERYAEGTLRGFLLHLDDAQRRYTDWALSGPTLLKGGPGSGKSTVALYRARAVIEHTIAQTGTSPAMLFTTYTNPLTNFSESLLCQLLRDVLDIEDGLPKSVRITTVDSTVMWIAKRSGRAFEVADHDKQVEALHHTRAAFKPRAMGELDKLLVSTALQNLRDEYLLTEFEWVIEGQNCRELAHYLRANRSGRAIPFNESLRSAVWKLYEVYRDYLLGQELLTWGQLRQYALDRVTSGQFANRWDYVIVDEAQDLTPVALSLCVELCRAPSGLFLTADANQSLYNRGFRWNHVHDQLQVTGRTRILRRNYRSTRQIAHAATEVLAGMDGADDEAVGQEFVHAGPKPVVYAAAGTGDQARWLAQQICAAARDLRLPVNCAAVLVPTNSLGQSLARLLAELGLPARFLPSKQVRIEERCVKVMTLYAAKGLEFPIVALAHMEADRMPRETTATDPEDIREHLENQRRVFYVGCTRAMRHLFITYDRSIPSSFLDLLSEDRWLKLE